MQNYLLNAIHVLNNTHTAKDVAMLACMLGVVTIAMATLVRAFEYLRDATQSSFFAAIASVLDKTTALFWAFFIPAMFAAVVMNKMGWVLS